MDSILEAKIQKYLIQDMKIPHTDCGTVLQQLRRLAQAGGFTVDERFAHAGLGAGPEARIASSLVCMALGKGGAETPEYAIRAQLNDWLQRQPVKGRY